MIKTADYLIIELSGYKAPAHKISRMIKYAQGLYSLKKGLYETDPDTPGYTLAGVLYGPSYLSFDFALSWHGMIPEAVHSYTSATFDKKKKKQYENYFGRFSYRDVPVRAYPYGIEICSEKDRSFLIASPEKALCDKLYTLSPVQNRRELSSVLFDNLRIDPDSIAGLNWDDLREMATLYNTTNHRILLSLLKGFFV